jgi:ABC-type nickel/cobalt efflux system permease component RcnA
MIQFFTGVLMSAVHVVSGPDHLAAVTPLAIENRRKAWHIGLYWGAGHVLGMLMIGLLYLAFKEVIPVDAISGYSEYLVGIVLIGIGIWAMFNALGHLHFHHRHPHFHPEPEPMVHIHSHEHSAEGTHQHQHPHEQTHRQNNLTALGVGTLHGFAGISHFLLILPTLTLPTISDSVLYLSGFGVGTIAAMVGYALIMGFIASKTEDFTRSTAFRTLRIASGLAAIGVGIYWLV